MATRSRLLVFVTAVLVSAALLKCAGTSPEVRLEPSADYGERAEQFAALQRTLISDASRDEARALAQTLERPLRVQPGRISGEVDLSRSTIDYYLVNSAEAAQSLSVLDLGDAPLRIVDYGPSGVLPIENRTPRVYVMFSRPMVPLTALGEVITESAILTLTPAVPGTYRWYGTRTLSFEPDAPLTAHPSYEVRVSDRASSLGGNSLAESFSFRIHPERLAIANVYAGTPGEPAASRYDVPTATARSIIVEFNQRVDLPEITPSIRVSIDQQPQEFSVRRPDYPPELASRTGRAVQLVLDAEPPEEVTVEIVVGTGARPQPGYPPTERDHIETIRTTPAFTSLGLSGYGGGFPADNRPYSYPVYLDFSHRLAAGAEDEEYAVLLDGRPIVPAGIDRVFSTIGFSIPNARTGQEVTVIAPATVSDVFGRELGSMMTETYTIPRPEPMIDVPSGFPSLRHLEAEYDPAILISMRNIVDFKLGMRGARAFFTERPAIALEAFDLTDQVPDYVNYHELDLGPYLTDTYGTVLLRWQAEKNPELVADQRFRTESGTVAVQVTDLGISARYAYNRILVWVNRLSDGSPVESAQVEAFNLVGRMFTGDTDSSGLAVIPMEDGAFASAFPADLRSRDDTLHLRVRKGDDTAEMRPTSYHSAYRFGVLAARRPINALEPRDRVHLFTDRGLYQAGEAFAFRGIHWLQDADGFTPASTTATISIRSYETEAVVWSVQQQPSATGGFAGRITLPEDLEHGRYELRYQYGPGWWDYESASFSVGSFRRVALEVTSRIERPELIAGETGSVAIAAAYLAGGAVAGAPYEYFLTRRPIGHAPPGARWEDWTFGTDEWAPETRVADGRGTLSALGTATIAIPTDATALEATEPPLSGRTHRYSLEVRVEDIDRHVIAHRASLLVHPADHHVAARFVHIARDGWWSRFVPVNDQIVAEARLVGMDGEELAADRTIRYRLVRREWQSVYQQGLYGRLTQHWEAVDQLLYEHEATARNGQFRHAFAVREPGRYILSFVSADDEGRETLTEIPFYATGSGWVRSASQTPSDIQMTVDRPIYEPGDTARILVQSPMPEGRYLLTVERAGILDERVIELSGSTEVIEVPVHADYVPVFYVALTGFTARTETEEDYFQPDLGMPRGLFGLTPVRVSTRSVELDVEIMTTQAAYGPGDEGDITVRVTRNGLPVSDAEVTVLGVDRGVLDLIGYHVPDPLEYFYQEFHFPIFVDGDDSRRLLLRPVTYDIPSLQGGDGDKNGFDEVPSSPLSERRDFSPLALFEPEVKTDSDGYARVTFDYPDNLTTYRFTALALRGSDLGMTEHEIVVQNPVNVRTALPRRLRNRDTAIAGIILTNTTDLDYEISVAVESDVLSIADETTRVITVPAHAAYELPFVLEAHEPGEGVIRFTVRSDVLNEVLQSRVIVERPLITEAVSTTGSLINGADDPDTSSGDVLMIPSWIAQSYGSLTIGIDTTLRSYIVPAMENLRAPAGPVSDIGLLYDLSLRAQGLLPFAGTETILERLARAQFDNGGIGYRPQRVEHAAPSLFLSLLTAQVLSQADEASIVLEHGIDRSALMRYLYRHLEEARDERIHTFLTAWNASLLAASGSVSPSDLRFLRDAGDVLGIAGNAMLAEAYLRLGETSVAKSIYARMRNFVIVGTQSVDVLETYEARGFFDSGAAEIALMLRIGTLLEDPDELLLRPAASLNQSRTDRRFQSVHDDFWIVHGFSPLLSREKPTEDVTVSVRLGEQLLLDRRVDADAPQSIMEQYPLFESPLAAVPRNEPLRLEVTRGAAGQVYYAATLRYALPGETALPRDEGIEVRRQIERLDGTVLDGERLPLGETLRMRVFLSTTRRLSYVNLAVPLPSGAEILDPTLRTTGSYDEAGGLQTEGWARESVYGDTVTVSTQGTASYGPDGWWYWFYRPIQRIYDNAMLYTWEDFYAGDREVSFLFRTTTPGIYPTPPVQASLEFEPEIFGRGGGRLYVIGEESD